MKKKYTTTTKTIEEARNFFNEDHDSFLNYIIFELFTLKKKLESNINPGFLKCSEDEIASIKGVVKINQVLYQIYKDNLQFEVEHIDLDKVLKDLTKKENANNKR